MDLTLCVGGGVGGGGGGHTLPSPHLHHGHDSVVPPSRLDETMHLRSRKPYGLFGKGGGGGGRGGDVGSAQCRKRSELRSCEKVEVAALGSPFNTGNSR